MTDHYLFHLELPVDESGMEITRLSARCQELERECKRLAADVNLVVVVDGDDGTGKILAGEELIFLVPVSWKQGTS